ncbi:MAG: BglG family transcription antiterminator [Peptostreptococcaceae bacterium]
MKEKSKMIISYLNSSDTYTPSSSLATYLNVSERSIKRYIKAINKDLEDYGAKIESAKRLGYKLVIESSDNFREYLNSITDINKSFITTDLLKNILKDYPISLDLLAEKLYTSRSTLQNELTSIRSALEEYNIKLKYKPYSGLYLEGYEEDIRKCCMKYFFKDENLNEISLSIELGNINNEFIFKLKKFIEKKIVSKKIEKNDYEILYLTKFIAITCFRANNGYNIDKNIYEENIYENIFDDEFKELLQKEINISLVEDEIDYLNMLLKANNIISNEVINEEKIKELVKIALNEIDIKYKSFLYEDSVLVSNLVKHILNSYNRYYYKIDVENIILDQVKRSYPDSFNYALDLSTILEYNLDIKINSNEVGYIAIHFATAIERAKQKTSCKAIIVCNTGIGTSELIRIKLRRYFPQIEVIGCYQVHYLDYINLDEIDFIISTINIENQYTKDKGFIQVSHVLNEIDIQKIEDKLNKSYLQSYLTSLFNVDIFYKNLELKDKKQLLEFVCSDMVNKDFISKEDKETILNREKLSSTEISDLVAVPHCISVKNKNAIAICILKDAINWGNTSVKLVFVACLDSDKKENKHIFPFIHSNTKKGKIVNSLCECSSLNEFIEILMRSNSYDS